MNLNTVSNVAKKSWGVITKNSPTILTCMAVGGLFTTVIFAVRATPKAIQIIDEHSCEIDLNKGGIVHKNLTKTEKAKLTWKLYIPSALMGATTIACIIGSNSINQKRHAALATVYGLTEAAFREYKEKVVETIGKNKELKLRDEITASNVLRNPPDEHNVIFTGRGDTLCKDSMSGRYFKSDIEYVRRVINEVNHALLREDFISLNDFYYELGLSEIKLGDLLGWEANRGLVEITFSSALTEKGEPCLVIEYQTVPKYI
jgi:hypothetical protein